VQLYVFSPASLGDGKTITIHLPKLINNMTLFLVININILLIVYKYKINNKHFL